MSNNFRTDVVGSLLRPTYLKEARAEYEAGRLSDQAFKQIEDRAVDDAIALQERAGIAVITDGELRRYAFYGHLIDALEGYDKYGGWAIPFRDEAGEELVLQRPVVVSKLQRKRHLCAEEFTYVRAKATVPAKVTLISAQQAAAYYDAEKSKSAYATVDAYLADLVDILRGEIAELIGELVLPLHAMEEVVAISENDDQGRSDTIARIVVAAIDDAPDERFLIVLAQMQMVEVIGEGAIGEVALPEIADLRI